MFACMYASVFYEYFCVYPFVCTELGSSLGVGIGFYYELMACFLLVPKICFRITLIFLQSSVPRILLFSDCQKTKDFAIVFQSNRIYCYNLSIKTKFCYLDGL